MCFLEVQPQMIFPNEITCKDTKCLLVNTNEINCFLNCQNLTTKLMIHKTCVFHFAFLGIFRQKPFSDESVDFWHRPIWKLDKWGLHISHQNALKFIYSEKAIKFCEVFILLLTTVHAVKSTVKILQNFVAFSKSKLGFKIDLL